MAKKKPKKGQLRFEYAIDSTQELVFEDWKGDKIKEKCNKDKKPSDIKKDKS